MKSIIELAREAGFNEAETEILKQEIISFADLVRAEDEALLRQALDLIETMPVKHPDQITPRNALIVSIKKRLQLSN